RHAVLDDLEDLVAGALPPVFGGEDFHFLGAVVPGGFDHGADGFEVDDAVAHHAAVVEHVAGGHHPVADMVGEDALHAASALDGALEIGVPPDVVDVDGDADGLSKRFADVERLIDGVHAGPVGRIHRMQGLDGNADAGGLGVGQHGGD